MSKKAAATVEAEAVAVQAFPIQSFPASSVKVSEDIATRKGAPNKDKVRKFADNFVERRAAGRPHQIMPGVVRVNEDGTVECVVGRHRLAACQLLDTMLPDGTEPFLFEARAVPSTNSEAIIDAVEENEFRTATSVFDRALAMQKLVDSGMEQQDVAKHFGVGQSTVSETLRAGKLPAKIKKMVADGTMTEEAALLLARYNKDTKLQEDITDLAVSSRAALDSIQERADKRATGTEETATDEATETEDESTETPSKGKTAKVSEAVKGKNKGKKATKGKVTVEDVKGAVKAKGAAKRKKTTEPAGRSKRDLLLFLEAMVGSDDVAEPIKELAGYIERYLDNDVGEKGLQSAFERCCRAKLAA